MSEKHKYKRFKDYILFKELGSDSLGINYRAGEMSVEVREILRHHLVTEVYPFLHNTPNKWKKISILLEGVRKSNIPKLYSPDKIIQEENKKYLVYPFLKGKTLAQILEDSAHADNPINCDLALSLAFAIADLIDIGSSIVVSGEKSFHGFLSPDNIIIDYDGKIYLKNYGIYPYISREEGIFTEMAKMYGAWIAPEFLRREKPVCQSDIYHLGYIIYRILTGKYYSYSPEEDFDSKFSNIDFSYHIVSGDKKFLTNIVNFFKKTLHPIPTQRFGNIKEFKDYISNYFHLEELSSVTYSLAYFLNSLYIELIEEENRSLSIELAIFPDEQKENKKKLTDIEIIKLLERNIGKKLKPITFRDILSSKNGYTLNEDRKVIGLNLSNLEISDIEILKDLIYLDQVNLGSNKISDISPINNLFDLSKLYLFNNLITDISSIKELKNLKFLSLSNNYISDISPLHELTVLNQLNLYNNQISDISPIKNLKTLTILNLERNRISDISALKKLTSLMELNLSCNHISGISAIKNMTALTTLNLHRNQISDISALKKLRALTTLNLQQNQISDISALKKLKSLLTLDLHQNQISDISPLKEFKRLTRLRLFKNQICEISTIKELTALTRLNLGGNKVWDISAVKELKNLKRLVLINNQISQIPVEMHHARIEIKWEYSPLGQGIFLEGNPLKSPPVEIVKLGGQAVRNYFEELEKDFERLMEIKILLLGDGDVGKTTLMRKLIDNNFKVKIGDEPTTQGINIVTWKLNCNFDKGKVDNVIIHFWDFGGQSIYHATHQFFLTKHSLYLFVWDVRKEEDTQRFDYWLNIIKILGGESPVLVVMNKSDVRTKYLDIESLQKKFKNIKGFFQVSCLNGNGIYELTEHIRRELNLLPHLQDKLPKVWKQIRDHLITRAETTNYIYLEEYFKICSGYGLNRKRADFLSDYLHNLGIILHFRTDILLENIVILNPEWATDAVYKIIDTQSIQKNNGRFSLGDLKNIWDSAKYPWNIRPQLIRLMEKFELFFNITGTDTYIVPELLSLDRPHISFVKNEKKGILHFQYEYNFMPKGIISHFICRVYYLTREGHLWRYGVVLKFEDSTASVISEPLNHTIKIIASGSCASELMGIIRNELEQIHHTLNMKKNQHYHEMIPCLCTHCKLSENPHLYRYDVLKRRMGIRGFKNYCNHSDEEVSIGQLLKGFEKLGDNNNLLREILISASHLQGLAKTIKPGEDNRNDIMTAFLTARGVLVKDQSRWGRSESGKSMGELDMKIVNEEQQALAVLEAFNLTCMDTKCIDRHLKKLFNYDTSGLKQNFIIVYVEVGNFLELWKKYMSYIPSIDFLYPLTAGIMEEASDFTDIRLARTTHQREGKTTDVYHIFINMKTDQR